EDGIRDFHVTGVQTCALPIFDGNYTLPLPQRQGTLVVSFVGYKTQEIAIDNRSIVNVTLETDLSDLEEVIVIGYGEVKKSNVTRSEERRVGKEWRSVWSTE